MNEPDRGQVPHERSPTNAARGWPARWSPARLRRRLTSRIADGRAGDGRERELVRHVLTTTSPNDLDAIIDAIDRFAYDRAFLMNIGDDKGTLLEDIVTYGRPDQLLELGTYCGYSALRIARAMPASARLHSVEPERANARVATAIWQHAGIGDRVHCMVGRLEDGGRTLMRLRDVHGVGLTGLDFLFLDHDKNAYLPDLQRVIDQDWLHDGSIVVADNVLTPGAPDYRAYMREQDGLLWQTAELHTHLEYRPDTPDLMLVSRYRSS